MTRVVLDASVVLAAILARNRRSASCVVIEAVAVGELYLVTSAAVVAEYLRVAKEHAASSRVADPVGFARDLAAAAEQVEPSPVKAVKADPSDDVYLGTAIAGGARYLATFDRRHLLPLDPFEGVRVVTPGDLLRAIR